MIDYNEIIEAAFTNIVGRLPDEESLIYWRRELSEKNKSVSEFIKFMIQSPEGIMNIDSNNYNFLLRFIYEKKGIGSSAGNPMHINYSKNTLCFLHVPKTAGISLSIILSKSFHPLQIKPTTFGEMTKGDLYRFYFGHFSVNDLDFECDNCIKVTSIRDPRARIISLYKFLSKVANEDKIWGRAAIAAKNNSLSDFLLIEDPAVKFTYDNYYTRVFSGKGIPPLVDSQVLTLNDLNKAKLNLSMFNHVITTEKLLVTKKLPDSLCFDLKNKMNIIINSKIERLNQSTKELENIESLSSIPDTLVALDYKLLEQYY